MDSDASSGRFFLGANPENPEEQFPVSERARSVHTYVVGASGVGKSKMLLDWIPQDVMAGRGCAVIDPKGDLIFDILAALSELDEGWWPSLVERLVLIDPADPETSVAFNPLEVGRGTAPARQRQEVFSIFRKIWRLEEARAPRLDLVLRRTLQLLMDRGLTLVEMPRVLTDADFREALLRDAADPGLRSFWRNEFAQSDTARFQWVSPVVTRIEGFLDDPAIRSLFGRPRSEVDFRRVMDRGMVLLVNLAKGRVGEETSFLLGGFLMAKLQLAAESRQEIWPSERRRLGYRIIESRAAFPDYILGLGRRRLLAEAEFRTSDFLRHRHDLTRCDLIIVWEHDLSYMPGPVLELKTEDVHRPRPGRPPNGLLAR